MGRFETYTAIFRDYPAPFAYVDLDFFDANADTLVRRAGGLPIRVASKSIRCLALLRRVLARPGFSGVLAYGGFEAVHLARAGIADIVVAYPIVESTELAAVADEVLAGKSLTLMIDSPEHLAPITRAADRAGTSLDVAIDLDLSSRWPGLHFGVHRSRISNLARLEDLLAALKNHPRIRVVGAMGYEAQIAGVPDTFLTRILKRFSAPAAGRFRSQAVEAIRAAGHSLRFVNGGGTGSFESTGKHRSVTELAAGSGLYGPGLFDGYDAFHPSPAAGFALRVTRKPEPNWVVCHSGGYIASGSFGREKLPRPYLPEALALSPLEGAGEVQTPLTGAGTATLAIGDLVYFRHAKAGEFCERFTDLHLVSKGAVVETVPTYRGEGKNFG